MTNMTTKILAIAAIITTVAMLAGIVATPPIYADESETETEIKCKIDNTSSGDSDPINALACEIAPPF